MFHDDDMFINWFYEILNNQSVLSLFPARNFAGDLPQLTFALAKSAINWRLSGISIVDFEQVNVSWVTMHIDNFPTCCK